MGAALDSLVMAIGIAGSVAALVLIWNLFARLRTEPVKRGVFKRLPLLLPAVTFVVSLIIVGQLGILPMTEYRGTNFLTRVATSGDRYQFSVYESNAVYSENVELTMERYLQSGESIISTIEFYLLDSPIESVYVNLTGTGIGNLATEQKLLHLDPGQYEVRVHNTFYEYGIPDDIANYWIEVTLSQPLNSSFTLELVTWSSIQFVETIVCFFLILGGLCIDDKSQSRHIDERMSEEPGTEYGNGSPEYGKGC